MTVLAALIAALREQSTRRSAVRRLRALPDELLHDIGIDRSEIESVVANGARARQR